MNEESVLQEVGLTRAESKIYLALLKLGSSTIGPLLKQSGLHSSVVYNCLQRLQEKGLVAYTLRDKVKYFSPTDPKKLVEILKEKEKKLLDILPELEKIRGIAKNKQRVFVYEGNKAVKVMFNDILHTLKRGDEQLVIGVSHTGSRMGEFIRRWDKRRVKVGIKKRVLITDNSKEWLDYYSHQPLTKVKILPNILNVKLTINVYGTKTMLILWGKYPICILIESSEITNNFRKYFDFLWSVGRS